MLQCSEDWLPYSWLSSLFDIDLSLSWYLPTSVIESVSILMYREEILTCNGTLRPKNNNSCLYLWYTPNLSLLTCAASFLQIFRLSKKSWIIWTSGKNVYYIIFSPLFLICDCYKKRPSLKSCCNDWMSLLHSLEVIITCRPAPAWTLNNTLTLRVQAVTFSLSMKWHISPHKHKSSSHSGPVHLFSSV